MVNKSEMEKKVLEELLNKADSYVSSAYLASIAGISKMTVSRVVRSLIGKGYPILMDKKRGYMLIIDRDLALLHEKTWKIRRRTFRFHYLEKCSSTQDIGVAMAQAGVQEYTVIVAEEQLKGRGRQGRIWVSPQGGLWFSIILRNYTVKDLTIMNLVMGLSVIYGIKSLYGLEMGMKWPNDIMFSNKKIGGALIEGNIEGNKVKYIVAGIGINANNDIPNELRDSACSLKEILGNKQPRSTLLKSILENFLIFEDMIKSDNKKQIVNIAKKVMSTLNKKVTVKTSEGYVFGKAYDLDENGGLVIISNDKKDKYVVYVGDIIHISEDI